MRRAAHLLCPLTALLLIGCHEFTPSPQVPAATIDAALRAQVAQLRTEVDALAERVQELEKKRARDEVDASLETRAVLQPESQGYQVIRTTVGALLVSIEDIEPYADGSRVTLEFGNASSATLMGVKATMLWQARLGEELQTQPVRSREVDFLKPLLAGRWTRVRVTLEEVPPDRLSYVAFRNITHNAVQMLHAQQ